MENNRIKAIIIDDEEGARIALSSLITSFIPEVEIVDQCSSVPQGVKSINKYKPELVFLDIEMPEYNGFELFDFFREIDFEIVFVTAYSHYAVRAFEVSSVDYILKPVEIENLKSAVEKVKEKKNYRNIMQRLDVMKETFKNGDISKIAVPVSDGLLFVDINDIILFEADRAYTDVFLKDGSKITVSKPMRIFEDILQDRNFIFRPHRSFLINIHFIKKYSRGESIIIMENKQNVSLSRDRKQEFENLLKDLKLTI